MRVVSSVAWRKLRYAGAEEETTGYKVLREVKRVAHTEHPQSLTKACKDLVKLVIVIDVLHRARRQKICTDQKLE